MKIRAAGSSGIAVIIQAVVVRMIFGRSRAGVRCGGTLRN
jgi:hypothetical protein